MGTEIDTQLAEWLQAQPVFFVASAPLAAEGHVNCSPKGLDTFRVLGPRTVAYLDFTGSGAETIAHLRENGRIVLMFCAFSGPPRIVRLHGRGRVLLQDSAQWPELLVVFGTPPGARAIIVVELTRVAKSCGFGVPEFSEPRARAALPEWVARNGSAGIIDYQRRNNRVSVDGLPALDFDDREVAD